MMEGKYKAYSEYHDSDIEWLGGLPSHWELKRLKYLGNAIIGLTYSPDDIVEKEEGVLVLRSSNVQNKRLAFQDNVYVSKEIPMKLKTQVGDILICSRNGSRALIGKNAMIDESSRGMSFGAFMTIFRSPYNQYLSKIFNSTLFEYQSGTFLTSTVNQLTTGNLNSFEIPFPSEREREQIANFLDYETAKIDTLIEKQRQLIKLLKEKRQAVISHAVTKGLNADAPMHDSGVEWLGEVPEHWTSCSLRRYADFVDGDRGSEYPNEKDFKNDGILFLSSKNIVEGTLDLEEVKYISNEKYDALNRGKAINGDLIVKVRGSAGRIGELAKFSVSEHGHNTAFINAQMMIIRTTDGLLPDYLRFVSYSIYWTEQLLVGAYGTAQQQLSNEVFSNLCIVVPPVNEQSLIIDSLNQDVSKFNNLIKKAELAINLINERRTALISAAVTGKIDVRDWKKPGDIV